VLHLPCGEESSEPVPADVAHLQPVARSEPEEPSASAASPQEHPARWPMELQEEHQRP
jgi:hypothetical protein